jgi:pimeloyl-ACP methyl ester carboxylesterase
VDPPPPEPPPASDPWPYSTDASALATRIPPADEVRIDAVSTGSTTRLIVYIGGVIPLDLTNPSSIASGIEAVGYWSGEEVDQGILDKIDAALVAYPSTTEIMLVGHSKGGIAAQEIAASGRYNVGAVVTFGSPVVEVGGEYSSLHLRATGDVVPLASTVGTFDVNDHSDVWVADPPNADDCDALCSHSMETYQAIAMDFDDYPTGIFEVDDDIKEDLARFSGVLRNDPTLPTF